MQHAPRITRLSALALGICGALALGQVHASGFNLKENSVKAMGAAYAGSAVDEGDTSVVVNNPAMMTTFEGTAVQADVSVIDLSYEFEGGGVDALGQPLTGGDGGNAGDVTPIPAFSMVHKFDNGVALGAMVSAPFGLKTEYEDGWVGRYYAHTSDVKIVDLTVSAAFEIVPERFSVGMGLIYSTADVTLSKAVDFGTLLFSNPATRPLPFARPQARDGFAEVQGDDTGVGWVAGLTFRPVDQLTFGLSYRSEIDYDLTGDVDWTVPQDVQAVFGASPMTSVLFQDGGATAKLTTPSITTVAIGYDVTDSFRFMANYTKTGWESLQEVRIDFDNPDPDSVEAFEWDDATYISLGTEFDLNPNWSLRAGVARDSTPTNDETRTPRLPDEDRTWYTLGATWQVSEQLDVNFAFARIEPDTPNIELVNDFGHQFVGRYEGSANLYGLSAQYRF